MSIENSLEIANKSTGISNLISKIDQFPIDHKSISQDQLDLVNRDRTSLFPWRGQFSPGLIELLLTHYANPKTVVLDPFVGSGTTLFETARKSLTCFGVDVNPAAVEMAKTVHFVNVDASERSEHIRRARAIIEKYIYYDWDLLSYQNRTLKNAFSNILREISGEPLVYNIIINVLLRYTTLRNKKNPTRSLLRAFEKHKEIVEQLPYRKNVCKALYCDARSLPFNAESVDLIVTSPPYINVFNYHQNYRKVMELAGWDLLGVAKSEIGSNRKNRGNRFLTVIQYAIDMLQALCEMRRVIRQDGRIVIIIGRESKVRGVPFENSKILSVLATRGASLLLVCRQERKFVNRFGKLIREDLLHFAPTDEEKQSPSNDFSRTVAVYFLKEATNKASNEVHEDIMSAIESANTVSPSPLFVKRKVAMSI